MSATAFVSVLLKGFSAVAQPVTDALTPLTATPPSTDALAAFLNDFGWTLAPAGNPNSIAAAFATIDGDITALVNDAQQLPADPSAADIAGVVGDLAKLLADIGNVAANFGNLNLAPFDVNEFQQTFPTELWPYLLHRLLRDHVSVLYGVLRFTGIFTETPVQATAVRGAYLKRDVDWSLIPKYATRPGPTFAELYHWADANHPLDHAGLIRGLGALVGGFPLASQVSEPSDDILGLFYPGARPPGLLQLSAAPVPALDLSGPVEVLFKLLLGVVPVPVAGGNPPDPIGLALFPILIGSASAQFQISSVLAIKVDGHFQTIPVIVEFRPAAGGGIEALVSPLTVQALAAETIVKGTVTLSATAPSGSPWILVGLRTSSHLELATAHLGVTAAGPLDQLEYTVEAGFEHLKLVLDFADADGFLQTTLGSQTNDVDLSCTVEWSRRTGFRIRGQADVEATIPIHLNLAGVLELDSITIAAHASTDGSGGAVSAGVTGGLTLGPVAASVDRVGVQINVKSATPGQGNLGDLDLRFAFKPPNGLGLAIDAGPIAGGGYIFCDPDKGEYAGVLELAAEVIQIKVIGILNTILPGGQTGFSLLLIVSAEFEPIQIGFGFTLNGVGGLAGINRTMVLDALRAGLKNHNLNSILFPKDPIAHAQQIISDLQSVFPPQLHRYVFGPMLELGYEGLIIAELGVILELPAPIRLAILGQLTAVLPDEDAAVVLIHMDVLGTVDFEKKYLTIDATLYDSRVTVYTLLGDMALRLLWGENANFALSVGGLHPRFQPPPGFPSLHRLTLSLGDGDNPRFSCDSYFAVTSNTVQFGAGISLYASAAGFTVEGHLGFDALFIISPFHFVVEISGSVDLKRGSTSLMSVSLDLELDGPNPWHASGTASAHILFLSVSVSFDKSWGDPDQVTLPGEDPTPKLLAALQDPRNWNAQMPSDAERAVSLLAPAPDNKTVLVHPLGSLGVKQKVLPLGLRMSKFGAAPPSGVDQFDVKEVDLNGQPLAAGDYITIPDNFAPAQFLDLSDDEKLSRPSFESHAAGVQMVTADVNTGGGQTLDVEYETILVDDPLWPGAPVAPYALTEDVFLAQLGQGAARFSPLRNTGRRKFVDPQAPDGSVTLGGVKYGVATTDDLSLRLDVSEPGSFTTVHQDLEAHLDRHPEDRDRLQIRPQHELAGV